MKKSNNTVLILVFMIFTFFGCSEDFLDKTPTDQISGPTFWKSEQDLILGANNLYRYLPGFPLNGSNSYLITGRTTFSNISDGSYLPSQNFGPWEKAYAIIRDATFLLENADNTLENEVSQDIVDRYKGEAYFFRAMAYYNLVKAYGDVPFITTTLNLESEELMGSRDTRTIIIDAILADLQTAADALPLPSELSISENGRITSSAALTLRARIALYEGTRERYHGYGTADSHLQIAKSVSDAMIGREGSEHDLFPNRANLFIDGTGGENSNEVILSRKYGGEIKHNQSLRNKNADVGPTKALADLFLDDSGLPIENASSTFLGYDTIDSEFKNRDPRMSQDFMVPLADDYFYGGETIPDFLRGSPTGYTFKKGTNKDIANEFGLETQDRILIRYSEVLLIYAEATYELSGSISDADLDKSINKLRARVGMPNLTNVFVTANGLDMLTEIRRERTIELAYEGQEWDDGIRWKTAEINQPKALRGIKFLQSVYPDVTAATDGSGDVLVDQDGFLIRQKGELRSFDTQKNYLFPLPLRELDLNPNLLPNNPGW